MDELRREIEFFEENLDEMLEEHEGEWVLIKDKVVYGFFESFSEADREAIDRFGSEPCLIKQVVEDEDPRRLY